MTLSLIGLGTVADDTTGDPARVGGAKVNSCIAFVNSFLPPTPTTDVGTFTTVVSNWATGVSWAQLPQNAAIRAAASSGNTDLHGIVSSGSIDGQYWAYYNPSGTDSTKINDESATCTTSADRIKSPGAGISVVGPQSHAVFRRDAISNRWTRVS